jgi:peptide/nickel transport system substrate-binding protein
MKQFHERYGDPDDLAKAVKAASVLDWAQLHDRLDNLYLSNNPDLPTLQPWVNRTKGPSIRFVAERNPYYHRVGQEGRQLPYIDRIVFKVVNPELMAVKTTAGDSDLQARGLTLADYTILKESESTGGYRTLLWRPGTGAQIALYPNLNVKDAVWRALMQDVRFRRALSLGIDRQAINQIRYYGLAQVGNNTVLSESPLSRESYRTSWAVHDPSRAAALLDEIGLTRRDGKGIRLLPDGRPLEIIVETAGEQPEQVDVLQLIASDWAGLGIKLLIRSRQREVLRKRAFAGETQMSVWSGLNNAVATADMSPVELAPTSQFALQWPRWGAYVETGGKSGEAPDLPVARELLELYGSWLSTTEPAEREAIWQKMLSSHADNLFSIGVVQGVPQPVAVKSGLMNLPEKGIYSWDPGAVFGVYRPDSFWWR